MSFKLKSYQNKLLFIPLGGSNEIGINVNLYHFKGKWIMIDCGSGFADDYLPGVNMVVADLSFIKQHKDDLIAIILTHAHEDHLGGIPYLLNDLECPIYATKFTKSFLKTKLSEYSFEKEVIIKEIDPTKQLDLGPFSIEMIALTHSAPEMQALMIKTEAGNILHTGDWKFDPNPLINDVSDKKALKACGDQGVLALVCDSTNVFNKGSSGSEGEVRDNLVKIIEESSKMVLVTTFASNLARLDTIFYAAKCSDRKVILAGRSMHRMFNAAKEAGYLQDTETLLIDDKAFSNHEREKLLVIATGCQGEDLAATAKIANDTHHFIKIKKEDTVIFSSKIIPGNDKKIFRLFNNFIKKGVEVITENDHFVHVSGHPAIEELKEMYKLTRPEVCIPVHGEPMHIHAHAKLARSNGIKHAIEVENGTVVLLEKNGSKIIDKVTNGYLAVDGNYLLPQDSNIFKIRRRMRDAGIVILSIMVNESLHLAADPVILAPGLLSSVDDGDLILLIKRNIVQTLDEQAKSLRKKLNLARIHSSVKKLIKQIIQEETGKMPMILINIEEIY